MNTVAERIFQFTDQGGVTGQIRVRIRQPAVVEFQKGKIWRSDVEVVAQNKVMKSWPGYGADSVQALEAAITLFQHEWPSFKEHNVGKWEAVIPDLG